VVAICISLRGARGLRAVWRAAAGALRCLIDPPTRVIDDCSARWLDRSVACRMPSGPTFKLARFY